MKRFALAMGVVLSVWSCGGDDSGPKGQYAEQCDTADDCADGLNCIFSLCTRSCTQVQDCQALSPNGMCVGGTCFDRCVDTFNCPNGLVCQMVASTSGTCRAR